MCTLSVKWCALTGQEGAWAVRCSSHLSLSLSSRDVACYQCFQSSAVRAVAPRIETAGSLRSRRLVVYLLCSVDVALAPGDIPTTLAHNVQDMEARSALPNCRVGDGGPWITGASSVVSPWGGQLLFDGNCPGATSTWAPRTSTCRDDDSAGKPTRPNPSSFVLCALCCIWFEQCYPR